MRRAYHANPVNTRMGTYAMIAVRVNIKTPPNSRRVLIVTPESIPTYRERTRPQHAQTVLKERGQTLPVYQHSNQIPMIRSAKYVPSAHTVIRPVGPLIATRRVTRGT